MAIKEFSQNNIVSKSNLGLRNFSGGYPSPYVENIVPIKTITVEAGGSSSILFDNIPQIYKHLHVRASFRSNFNSGSNTLGSFYIRPNSDSGSNYFYAGMVMDGGGMGHEQVNSGATTWYHPRTAPLALATANVFGVSVWDIFDYTNNSRWKTAQATGGVAQNTGAGSSEAWTKFISTWRNTSPITSLFCFTDNNFVEHSRVTLYGVVG